MPPPHRKTPRQRRIDAARLNGFTTSVTGFEWVSKYEDRVNIITEGDSWFAYPPNWVLVGEPANLVSNMLGHAGGSTKAVNTLCLASNGDTADEMMSGKQLRKTEKILERHGERLDLFMISAGGNDFINKEDFPTFLKPRSASARADELIDWAVFDGKMSEIHASYTRLLELCARHAPAARVVGHTYDYAKPSPDAAEFLWGVEVAGPWMHPALLEKGIVSDRLQLAIVKRMLQRFAETLTSLQAAYPNFTVIDTQGQLRPGDDADWLNEIHPTPDGFRKVGKRIYRFLRTCFPELPTYPI